MKRILILLPLLLVLVGFAAPDIAAQTVLNDSLHPGTYGWAVRTPWRSGLVTAKITHTAAAAKADTITLTGITSSDKVLFTRLAPAKKAVREPTITIGTDKVILSFDAADTLTYVLQAIRQ